jgi:hypothetical protein
MGMRKRTLNFLDRLTARGINHFSIKTLQVFLVSYGDVGRNEIKAYTRYLIDSGLIKNTNGEIYKINNDLRLDLEAEEENAKNSKNEMKNKKEGV